MNQLSQDRLPNSACNMKADPVFLELKPVVRPAVDNCFCRLPPHVARQLWEKQRSSERLLRNEAVGRRSTTSSSLWSIQSETGRSNRCSSGIEFLPLALIVNDGSPFQKKRYISYNGGDSTGTFSAFSVVNDTYRLPMSESVIFTQYTEPCCGTKQLLPSC